MTGPRPAARLAACLAACLGACLGACLAVAAPARPARAQDAPVAAPAAALARDCEPARLDSLADGPLASAWERRHHPRAVLGRLAPLVARGALGEAVAAAVADARDALALAPPAAAARYQARLDALARTTAVLVTLPPAQQARYQADSVQPALFQLDQLPAGGYRLFAGTPDAVTVTAADPPAARRALCWPAVTIERVFAAFDAPRRARTVEALDALAERWDNFVANGYSQFPWELALNGRLLARGAYEPPRRQWVLLHPSLGVEANGLALRQLRRVDVAALEALGLLVYNGDRTRYAGLSAVATLAADRNVAAGLYAHLWYPQAKLGYVVRSDPERVRRGSALVSVDLYDLLSGVPDRLRQARERALGGVLLGTRGRP